jgi:hypothetical protein
MSAARLQSYAGSSSGPASDQVALFKEDRPRRIDRVISFFGEGSEEADDPCGEALLESFEAEPWSER